MKDTFKKLLSKWERRKMEYERRKLLISIIKAKAQAKANDQAISYPEGSW